jgi:hypothetical protein
MSSEKRWSRRVASWRASGLTSRAFCEGRPFSAGALRHWAYLLRQRETAVAAAPAAVRLVRVERATDVVESSPPESDGAASARSESMMTIELGAARVLVPAGFDPATLRAALDALGDGGRR